MSSTPSPGFGPKAQNESQPEPRTPVVLSLQNVSKSYREGQQDHRVLSQVSLQVRAGEFVVLLGKSGSGKTTLLNLLSGIDVPDSGTLEVNGRDLARLDDDERTLYRRRDVGFVFQFFNLIPTLSVRENVLLPLDLNDQDPALAARRAADMLDRVGLLHRANELPDRLSGGEKQRVAVARALAHQPSLVLADEPTGNLDVATGRVVLSLLDELTRGSGKTLVMATHSHEVASHADRVFTVESGQLVATKAIVG